MMDDNTLEVLGLYNVFIHELRKQIKDGEIGYISKDNDRIDSIVDLYAPFKEAFNTIKGVKTIENKTINTLADSFNEARNKILNFAMELTGGSTALCAALLTSAHSYVDAVNRVKIINAIGEAVDQEKSEVCR